MGTSFNSVLILLVREGLFLVIVYFYKRSKKVTGTPTIDFTGVVAGMQGFGLFAGIALAVVGGLAMRWARRLIRF